jgi:hypothetical protein
MHAMEPSALETDVKRIKVLGSDRRRREMTYERKTSEREMRDSEPPTRSRSTRTWSWILFIMEEMRGEDG